MALNRCVAARAPASTGGARLVVGGVAVAEGDDHAGIGETADQPGRRLLGGDGHQQRADARARRDQPLGIGLVERAHELGAMRALARGREMRAFEMQADDAGDGRDRRRRGVDRADGVGIGRGDQRRQQRGGAEAAMRVGDAGDPPGIERVVEHHAAAAIHLQVDEARREDAAVQRLDAGVGGNRVVGNQVAHRRAVGQHGVVLAQVRAVEHARTLERDHSVSVTLRRLAGRSGSKPRARVTCSIRR